MQLTILPSRLSTHAPEAMVPVTVNRHMPVPLTSRPLVVVPSPTLTDPLATPGTIGVNATRTVQLCAAANETALQPSVTTLKPGGGKSVESGIVETSPMFVRVYA